MLAVLGFLLVSAFVLNAKRAHASRSLCARVLWQSVLETAQ
jgi:hypothetical protein